MTELFIKSLTTIDYSYLDITRGLVGDTLIVDLNARGKVGADGMVCDFGSLKKICREHINRCADHMLLLPGKAEYLEIQKEDDYVSARIKLSDGHITYRAPGHTVSVLDSERVDTASIHAFLLSGLQDPAAEGVDSLDFVLRHEQIEGSSYNYTHSLRKHPGNCQRIAHGHRSRLEIYRDERRDEGLENSWSELWCDRYIGSELDLDGEQQEGYYRFAYTSSQGDFMLDIPRPYCYLLPRETTAENMAGHILHKLIKENPGSNIGVKVYEGVDKGVVAGTITDLND